MLIMFILYIDVFVLWLLVFKTFAEDFPAKIVDSIPISCANPEA